MSGALQKRFEDVADAVSTYRKDANIELLQKAYLYSAQVHAGQMRKSGEPYLVHPIEVAFLLTRLKLDEASVATGFLHDTVEDTLATLEGIEEGFGKEVKDLVDGVTKLSQMRFDTEEHKQAENFRKMLLAMAKDIRVILVKLCDRLHNMRTLTHMKPQKQVRIAQETLDIYAPLANRLGVNWIKSELEDLSFKYLLPEDYADLARKVRKLKSDREAYVRSFVAEIERSLSELSIECTVEGRPKHLYSLYKKMTSQRIAFDEIYDAIAFRILVADVGQCYGVLGHVHALWHPIPGRFKDYIAMPKPNQYQSLHTSVVGPDGERVEIQIRTHQMHQIAEEGIAAHWEYKEKGLVGGPSDRHQFAWLRQLLEWQQDVEDPNEFLDTVKYDLFTDEVFVFTPRGEVVSLKRGATPVDFAFSIHTDVGLKCAGAKVNGRMVPLRHQLKNGDMVEVVTNPTQRPSKDWLKFVATGRAKSKIRSYVRGEERERSRQLGQEMLERDLRRNGISLQQIRKRGELAEYAKATRHVDVDSLYVALGYGRTTTTQIIERLRPGEPVADMPVPVLSKMPKRSSRRSSTGVRVQGIDDVLVRFAKCCSALRGDPIIGFVSRGRGITVHHALCARALDADPERRIEVDWDDTADFSREITVKIFSTDRPGLLATVSQTFSDHGVNIAQANCKVTGQDRAVNTFDIMVRDAEQLRKVVNTIRGLSGVIGVERQ